MMKSAISVLTLMAVLAIAFFFASNRDDPQALERSGELIARYDSHFNLKARDMLGEFWADHPAGAKMVAEKRADTIEYNNFVKTQLPHYQNAMGVVASLREISRLYDRVLQCRNDTNCNSGVLRRFYCPLAAEHSRTYQPFFDFIRSRTKLELGDSLVKFSRQCD